MAKHFSKINFISFPIFLIITKRLYKFSSIDIQICFSPTLNFKILLIFQKFSISIILFFHPRNFTKLIIIIFYKFTSFPFSIIIQQLSASLSLSLIWKEERNNVRNYHWTKVKVKIFRFAKIYAQRYRLSLENLAALDGHPRDRIAFPPSCKCVPTVARGSRDSKTIGNTPLTLSTAALSWHRDRFTIFERSWGESRFSFRSTVPKKREDRSSIYGPPSTPPISFHSTHRARNEEGRRLVFKYFFLPEQELKIDQRKRKTIVFVFDNVGKLFR